MVTLLEQRSNHAAFDFLAGGGEMGARMRSMDWAQTPLGPVESWPQSLRSAISILLPSRAQIVLFWGPDLVAVYNDAYAPAFGAKHPWALGKPARECWAEVWEGTLEPLFSGVLQSGEAFYGPEFPFLLERHGFLEETYYDVSYDPVRIEDGTVGGIFCIVSDRTERVLERRRVQTLREMGTQSFSQVKSETEACGIAAQALGKNGRDIPFALIYLIDADRQQARLVAAAGIALETPNSPLEVLLDSDANSSVWRLEQVAASNKAELIDTLQIPGLPMGAWDEPPRSVLVLPVAAPGQELPTALLVAAVSPRRLLDDVYQNFYHTIAGHIATAIANARAYEQERKRAEALAELDRAKTDFFSNVSHEFRTPLTLMLGPLEDTLAEEGLPQQARERLEVAHRNSLRLLKLVNTLLDFSRIEAGRMQAVYEPSDLAACTAELASVFRSAIERAGMRLVVDCPPLEQPVYVDREMWEKIVLNLLSNAFKFTFAGEIKVTLRQVGKGVELEVRDTGTGIPVEELPHLFERFHRVKGARGRSYEGSGIGLALVRELAKLHGGNVRVESEVDRGSAFTVTIPLGTGHLPAERIGAARTLASTGLRGEAYVEEALRWLPGSDFSLPVLDFGLDARTATQLGQTNGLQANIQPAKSRILLAEDNADMREYVRRLLAAHYEVEAVADGEAALQVARERLPELVLADVMMPKLDGFGLLRALRADERTVTIPILLLSARAGEEARIEGMEAGADDYLVKPFSARELQARVEAHLKLQRVRSEAQRALRASEEKFAAAFGQSPLALTITSLDDGRLVEVNETFVRLSGYTREEVIGHTPEELGLWVEPGQRAEILRQLLAGERISEFEARFRTKTGEERTGVIGVALVEINARPHVLSSVADLTERKQAEMAFTFLAEVSQDLSQLTSIVEVMQIVGAKIGAFLQLSLCAFIEINETADEAVVTYDWHREDVPSVLGTYRLSEYLTEDFQRAGRAGEIFVVRDVFADPRTAGERYAAHKVGAFVCVPLVRDGHWRFMLAVYDSSARDWRAAEIELIRELTNRIWIRLERARAEEALRESEEKYRTLFESIDQGFCTIEVLFDENERPIDYQFLTVNPAFARQTGIENAVGRRMREIAPLHEEYWFEIYGRIALTGEPMRFENHAEQLGRYYDVYAFRIGTPEQRKVAILFNDITGHKRAEQSLKEADRRKDEFLAMLAHELRNPLAPIRNAIHVLRQIGPSTPQVEQMRDMVDRQTEHLTRLVDDLLDVSRITRGKITLHREKLELMTVLSRAVETSRPLIDAAGHQLTLLLPPKPIQIEGDATRLAQVVSNLLNNAAKYTEPGGSITLSAAPEADEIVIRVRDNGVGISEQVLPQVFDLFAQADRSLDRAQGGLGLGLTIVKNLVEMHGGRVAARSEGLGKGSEFTVRLPVFIEPQIRVKGQAVVPVQVESTAGAVPSCRILVVDDNVDSAESMTLLLQLEGHEARTAHDGPETLRIARDFRPQVVLLDIGLPGMDGYEVARQLRQDLVMQKTVLIALTGYGQAEDRMRSKEAGFDHHLTKPVDHDLLLSLIYSQKLA